MKIRAKSFSNQTRILYILKGEMKIKLKNERNFLYKEARFQQSRLSSPYSSNQIKTEDTYDQSFVIYHVKAYLSKQ